MKSEIQRFASIAVLVLAALSETPGAGRAEGAPREACWDLDRPARVWPAIVVQPAADLQDYRRTMSQNRDEVREMLTGEFAGVLREVTGAGGASKDVLESSVTGDSRGSALGGCEEKAEAWVVDG